MGDNVADQLEAIRQRAVAYAIVTSDTVPSASVSVHHYPDGSVLLALYDEADDGLSWLGLTREQWAELVASTPQERIQYRSSLNPDEWLELNPPRTTVEETLTERVARWNELYGSDRYRVTTEPRS